MTRIIGGTARGRRLKTPTGEATRPTSDRVREALFSSLEAELGSLTGLRVLDLYAGSGALGLEAVSRGAQVLTSVESDRRTARLVQDNARELGFAMVEVVALPVARFLAQQPRAAYDLVLVDPPYAVAEVELGQVLHLLTSHGWLDADRGGFAAMGLGGQQIAVDPARDLVIVVNSTLGTDGTAADLVGQISRAFG